MKIILLGPPGAGKGTQAEVISNELKIPHISTGDILRESIRNKTSLGEEAKKIMDQGKLVSDEIILGIIKERVSKDDCKFGFLFDGFPRTIGQADGLKNLNINIDLVLEISLSDEVIISRMSGRRIHLSSGRSYHIEFNPPKVEGKDDLSGEDLIQRDDDKPETVLARLEVYKNQTNPLINYYQQLEKQSDLRFVKVNGANSPKEVSNEIFANIE
ncbi:MAG: adenylate kinase [Proteobacteria bacterium]|nr:adenylate kinase [Pseudomonadota bacterium]RZO99186.1 MAG: adenylate kinase [Gammaproteobacteria bacterium]|tara:strand:+ start:1994 stop:2638 length:645 start_codon:yes stop_codon:yes gene_type:complete